MPSLTLKETRHAQTRFFKKMLLVLYPGSEASWIMVEQRSGGIINPKNYSSDTGSVTPFIEQDLPSGNDRP